MISHDELMEEFLDKFSVIFVGIRSMIDEKFSLLFKREVLSMSFHRMSNEVVWIFRVLMHM